jgi:hypothetical protein
MASLPPPPVPARPDLIVDHRPTRRRFPVWATVLSVVLVLALGGAAIAPLIPGRGVSLGTDFDFLERGDDGKPVRWNPCRPIHYVVNASLAPPGSIADVHEAVRRISQATGIAFVYDGTTDEQPTTHRDPYLPSRYGDRWAPLLIAWSDPDVTDIPFERDGSVASGVATPLLPNSSPAEVYVSGWVAINDEDPNPPGFDTPNEQGPVILHELGHVMGLGHVRVAGELMQSSGGGVVDLGPGDLEGLRRLGSSQGCVDVPPARA